MEHVPFYKVSQISLFLRNLLFLTSFLLFLSKLVLKEIHEYGILSLHIYNQIVKIQEKSEKSSAVDPV